MRSKKVVQKKAVPTFRKRQKLKGILALFLSASLAIGSNTVIVADTDGNVNTVNSQNGDVQEDNGIQEGDSNGTQESDSNGTPEGDSNGTPEDNSNGTPEGDSNGTPESDSNGTPEDNSNEPQEDNSNEAQEGDRNGIQESDSNGTPEGDSNGTPGGDSNGIQEGNSNGTPESDSNGTPGGDSNGIQEGNSNGTPESDSNGTPEGDSNGIPEGDSNGIQENNSSEGILDGYPLMTTTAPTEISNTGLDLTSGLPTEKTVYGAGAGTVTVLPIGADGRQEIVVENATIENKNMNGNGIVLPSGVDIDLRFRGTNSIVASEGGVALSAGGSLKMIVEQDSYTKVITSKNAAGIVSPRVDIEGNGTLVIQGSVWGIDGAGSIGADVKGFVCGSNGGVKDTFSIDENNHRFFSVNSVTSYPYYIGFTIDEVNKSLLQYKDDTGEVVAYWDGQEKTLTLYDGYGKDLTSGQNNSISFEDAITDTVTVKIEGQVNIQVAGDTAIRKKQGDLTVEVAENASLTIKQSGKGIVASNGAANIKLGKNAKLVIETDEMGISGNSSVSLKGGSVVMRGMAMGITSNSGKINIESGHLELQCTYTALNAPSGGVTIEDGVTGYAYRGINGVTTNNINNKSEGFTIGTRVTIANETELKQAITDAKEQEKTILQLTKKVEIKDIKIEVPDKKDIVLTGSSMELVNALASPQVAVLKGGRLTLKNIEVTGNNSKSMFEISGTFVLGEGAVIQGSTNSGGIIVQSGGECIIDGGEIMDNEFTSPALVADGGKIVMKKGKITGNENTSTSAGGGIAVMDRNGSQLLYYGGEISGNIWDNGESLDIYLDGESKLQAAASLYTEDQGWKMYVHHTDAEEGYVVAFAEGAEDYQMTEKDLMGFEAASSGYVEKIFYDSVTNTLQMQGKIFNMRLVSAPNKVNYVEGEKLDLTGLKLKVNISGREAEIDYSDFGVYGITATPAHGDVLTKDMKEIVVSRSGFEVKISITVTENPITVLAVTTVPDKVDYVEGEKLDLTGLKLTVTWKNGQTEEIGYSDFGAYGITAMPAHGEALTKDVDKVVLSIGDIKADTRITVTENPITGLAVKTVPSKVSYVEGEKLNLTGLKLTVTRINGQPMDIGYNDFVAYGITATPAHGEALAKEIDKVVFSIGNIKAETSITVEENTVTDLAVKTVPSKVRYVEDEKLELTGLKLTVTWRNGQTEEISYNDFGAYGITATPAHGEALTKGVKEIVFSYGNVSVKTPITVKEGTTPPTPGERVTITFDSQGGSPVARLEAKKGQRVKEPNAPVRDGYVFTGWYTDLGCTTAWKFAVDTVKGNMTLYAGWKEDDGVAPITKHTITATVKGSGRITPSGLVTVEDGADQIFTIKASKGYRIQEVLVNGQSMGRISDYAFRKVKGDQTIEAVFEVIPTTTTGGGGGGGGGGRPKPTTVTGADGMITTTIVLTPTVEKQIATIQMKRSEGKKVSQDASKKKADNVVIKVKEVRLPITKTQLSLPKEMVDTLAANFIVETQLGKLGIRPETLESIAKADGRVLKVVLEKLSNGRYKATLAIGGKTLTDLGQMTVTVPYEQKTAGHAVSVKIYNSDGSVDELQDVYDREKKEVRVTVDGSVEFSIEERTEVGVTK